MSTTQIRLIIGVAAAVVLGVIVFALVRDGGGDGFGATGTAPNATEAAPPLTQPPLTAAPTTAVASIVPVSTSTQPPLTTAPANERPSVVVPGTVAWTDSGIDVATGDIVHYRAEGLVSHSAPDPDSQVGPGGDRSRPELAQFNVLVNGVPMGGSHAGLIGRIGDGTPFVMGQAGTLAVDAPGRLFLGINDQGLDNNDGEFAVELERQAA